MLLKYLNLKQKKYLKDLIKFDEKFLKKVKKVDYFYKSKFKYDMFKFPFLLSYFKNFMLNTHIFIYLIFDKCLKNFYREYNKKYYFLACSKIFEKNIIDSHNLYQDELYKKNFERPLNLLMNISKIKKKLNTKY